MNPLIKGIAIIFGAVMVIVLVVSYTQKSEPQRITVSPPQISSDRDSESEAVRAVSTGINELRTDQEVLKEDNKNIREKLDSLGVKFAELTDKLTDFASGREVIRQRDIVEEVINAIDNTEENKDPLGGDVYSDVAEPDLILDAERQPNVDALRKYVWYTPVVLVAPEQSNITSTQPPTVKPLQNNEHRNVIPSGTMIPSRTITGLIGLIPVDGRVENPWPFKAVATDMAHAANYYETDVHGMIFEGTAIGDYSFKCVRGRINKINTVLADGRVITIASNEDGLGWLSDVGANPCLPGTYVSNIGEHFGKQTLFEILSSAAKATARAEQTNIVSADGVTRSAITGDELRATFAEGIAGLADSAKEFYEQRGDAWDAVYVKPNKQIVVHITEEVILKPDDNKQLYDRNAITYQADTNSHSDLD